MKAYTAKKRADKTPTLCAWCCEPLTNYRGAKVPLHSRCKDLMPQWAKDGRADPKLEREARKAAKEAERIANATIDRRSDIRAGYEDDDYERLMQGIMKKAKPTEHGCLEWQGRIKDGYPLFQIAQTQLAVHRLALEAKEGKPLGVLAAHHKCANSICVNPDHLQPVTSRENTAEMLARKSLEARIDELEEALRTLNPNHEALNRINHRAAA